MKYKLLSINDLKKKKIIFNIQGLAIQLIIYDKVAWKLKCRI